MHKTTIEAVKTSPVNIVEIQLRIKGQKVKR